MAVLDFPASPTTGQVYNGWQWDGTKWVPVPGSGGGGIPEAPQDSKLYGRENAAWAVVPTASAAAGAPGANILHNPVFRVQQRGAGPWTGTGGEPVTADRWMVTANGTGATSTASIITLTDADRTAIGDESAEYALRHVFVGGASSSTVYTQQRIEDGYRVSNKQVTCSFWARAATAGIILGAGGGMGGIPSSDSGQVTLTTTWARYSVTFHMPSMAGNSPTYGLLSLQNSASSNYDGMYGTTGVQSGTVDIWNVKLELGPTMTAPERIDPQQDLAKCQRYFQANFFAFNSYCAAGGQFGGSVPFAVPMRANPTVAFSGISYGNCASLTASFIAGGAFTANANATAAAATTLAASYTASADL